VKFPEDDDLQSDWLPVVVQRSLGDRFAWPLKEDEQVVCLMDDGCETGVIIGAIYSDPDPPAGEATTDKFRIDFEDGTWIEYDNASHKLKANVEGEAEVKCTVMKLDGDLQVTGTIEAIGNISSDATVTGGIDVKGGPTSVSLATHMHTGITTGGSTSGPPAP
jgi:phage baseplate assembly protein V